MTSLEPGKDTLNLEEIKTLLPHRYPLLLIDRLIDIRPGEGAIGIKNVTNGEPVFEGHFPQKAVLPGVYIVEAMAQAAAAYTSYTENLDTDGKIVLFMGIDKARFRRPVVPGDQMRIAVRTEHRRPPVWKFFAEATVDGNRVAEAYYSAMLAASA